MALAALFLAAISNAGAEGTKEMDFGGAFPAACADCHGPEPKYPILGARTMFNRSGHYNFVNSYYANGGGCQTCHTNEGFIQYVKTGKDPAPADYVAYPSQQGCFTCHDPHGKGDFSLRTTKAVALADKRSFDGGGGNLCANCHRARVTPAATVKAMAARDVRSSWGAHHGPQADVLLGTGAYQYPGKSYGTSPHALIVQDTCVACHMALPTGRYGLSPELGGHSFNIAGEVHENELVNLSACVACHKDMRQIAGTELFGLKAKADYDNDGNVESVQQEIRGLLEVFVNERGTGLLQKTDPPMFKRDAKGTFESVGADWAGAPSGQWTAAQIAALYNYKLILEDRSLGVHNATYTIQVLYDTIESLTGMDTSSRRPR
jgi:cytochrome c551/c552